MSDLLASNEEVAAINHIPPELLSEIFVRCLPTDSASQDTQQLLSSVCRLWRRLVLATPALWASLDITCDSDFLRPPLPSIHTHLQRSGTHTLSFKLNGVLKQADSPSPNLLPVLTGLAAARQRWCKVVISLSGVTKDILDLITVGDAPLLQSIRCSLFSPNKLPAPLCMLDCCPRLESFHWDSASASRLLPLGNTQLTSLFLQTHLSVFECVTLLRLSPRLTIAMFHCFDSDSSTAPHLTHLELHTLTVGGKHFPALLAALTLPALLDLHVSIWRAEQGDIGLSAFLARNKSTLRRLSLFTNLVQGAESGVLSTLALTPHLRYLKLSTVGMPRDSQFLAPLIRALHPPPPPSAPLCPHLRGLNLPDISDCPDGLCGAMLRARWGANATANRVACLEWAQVKLMDGVHDRDHADIEALCAEGMQAVLTVLQ